MILRMRKSLSIAKAWRGLAAVIVCWSASGNLSAQPLPPFGTLQDTPPSFVENFLDQYRDTDVPTAVKTLVKGSSIESSSGEVTVSLQGFVQNFGKVDRWETIACFNLGRSLRYCYFVIAMQNNVVYAEIVAYQAPGGWIAAEAKFSPNHKDILPAFVMPFSPRP
jgi:hypothetical protein